MNIIQPVSPVGTGAGKPYAGESNANQLYLKSIAAGSDMAITNGVSDITIANSKPENTTVANVGTGAGLVYRDKTGDQINLKTVKAGSNITVTNNADDITLAATGGASSIYWEDFVPYNAFYFNEGISTYWNGNLDSTLAGFKAGNGDRFTGSYLPHKGYAGGQLEVQWWAWLQSAGSSSTHEFSFKGRWIANGDDIDVAYSNVVAAASAASGTGWRGIVSAWANFTPDGSWAANKFINMKIYRSESNSDEPYFSGFKIRYPINI